MYEDKTLVCKECGQEFVFTAGEQEFYAAASPAAGRSFPLWEKNQRFCDGHIEWPRRIDRA